MRFWALVAIVATTVTVAEFRHSQTPQHRKEFDRIMELDRLHQITAHFAQSNRHSFRPPVKSKVKRQQPSNPFFQTHFDPNYEAHDLCDYWNSGSQQSDLTWAEPADKLFRLIDRNVEHGYNMFMAPGQYQGTTTNVSVALYIESMSSVKAQTMDFEVDCYLAMGWYDRRLAHNCSHPILITHKFIADELWNPDLYYVNAKYAYLQEVTTPNFMMFVYPDGLVFKSMRTVVTLSCMVDLQYFPMDKQECPLIIQSFAYIENILNLSWHVDPPTYPIASNADLKLNDMMIMEMKFEKCSGPYTMFRGTGNWSCIRATIVMKRLMLYHIVQTYIPSAMLVSISWMTFFLPPRASPARISLTITSLLTLTTMSNGARSDLPQVSYISALDIWHFVSQALIFLVLLEYSFVSYYITRGTSDCRHRRISMSNRIINGTTAAEDLRIRLLNSEEISGRKSRADSMSSINPRVRRLPQKTGFNVNSGVGQSIANAAMLCGMATQMPKKRWADHRMSVAEMEAETAELYATQCNVSLDDLAEATRPCGVCALENEQKAKRIDSYSCVAFPSFFAAFSIIYWIYYYYHTFDYR